MILNLVIHNIMFMKELYCEECLGGKQFKVLSIQVHMFLKKMYTLA